MRRDRIMEKLRQKSEELQNTPLYFDFTREIEIWADVLDYIYDTKCECEHVDVKLMVLRNDKIVNRFLGGKRYNTYEAIIKRFPHEKYFAPLIKAYYDIDITQEVNPDYYNLQGRRMWYTWYGWSDGTTTYSIENLLAQLAAELVK